MKDELNSISLAYYGVWTEKDFEQIVNTIEELHFSTKMQLLSGIKKILHIIT